MNTRRLLGFSASDTPPIALVQALICDFQACFTAKFIDAVQQFSASALLLKWVNEGMGKISCCTIEIEPGDWAEFGHFDEFACIRKSTADIAFIPFAPFAERDCSGESPIQKDDKVTHGFDALPRKVRACLICRTVQCWCTTKSEIPYPITKIQLKNRDPLITADQGTPVAF